MAETGWDRASTETQDDHHDANGVLAMRDRDGAVIWKTLIGAPRPGSRFDIDEDGVPQVISPDGDVMWKG